MLRHDGEEYIASPYALIWDDDRYYLAAHSDKRNKLVKFRVDRMCEVTEIDIPAHLDDDFNAAEYSRKVIKMFDDGFQERMVVLRCDNELMQNVLDRFGEETETVIEDEKTFSAYVTVVPSSTFFGWVVQYKGGIVINQPADVKIEYENMLKDILEKQSCNSEVIKSE